VGDVEPAQHSVKVSGVPKSVGMKLFDQGKLECAVTSYLGHQKMSNVKLTDVLRIFDGAGDVVEWLEKLELVMELKKIDEEHIVLPMFLEGSALAVYTELSKEEN